MKQLNLFDLATPNEPPAAELPSPPEPKEVEGCFEILGVRYSLTPVEGWPAVRHFEISRGDEAHPLVAWDQVVWVDPWTIDDLLWNRSGLWGEPKDSTVWWGFGPAYTVPGGFRVDPLDLRYRGETERVSFAVADIDSFWLAYSVYKVMDDERCRRSWEKWSRRREAACAQSWD